MWRKQYKHYNRNVEMIERIYGRKQPIRIIQGLAYILAWAAIIGSVIVLVYGRGALPLSLNVFNGVDRQERSEMDIQCCPETSTARIAIQ